MKINVKISLIFALILMLSVGSYTRDMKNKRAFTLEDVYRIKGISGLSISPDGQKLLFTVSSYELKKGKRNSEIHLMDLKTEQQIQLTVHEKSDFHPIWSADGKKIYFISTRKDGSQIWEINPAGGESRRVSDFYTGVSSSMISPLNDKIFFTSSVFPECMADGQCNQRLEKQLDEGVVQAHLADSLLYRHWTSYRDWRYTHLFYLDLSSNKVHVITGGQTDYPPFSPGGSTGFSVSPDGKEICISGNHDKKLANSTNSDLFLVDLEVKSFTPINITQKNRAYDGVPSYSPDGKYIAYLTQQIPGYEADKFRLALYNRETKMSEVLTESIDDWIGDFHWSHDSRYIYYTVMEAGYSPLYRIHLKTKRQEKILRGHSIREFVISPDGKKLIFTRSSVGEPYEIWHYQIGKRNSLKPLTTFHEEIGNTVDIRPAEEHWIKGANDQKVHVFVVKPYNFDPEKKYPLIINIHGGPQMMWSDSFRFDWQVYPGAGYIVAFPNPHGSTGYGQEFTAAISTDWNGKVMEDIARVTDYLAELDYVDEKRMGVMGWSWGGYAVMWLEGNSQRYKALAAMMGLYDLDAMYSATEELWFPEWDLGGTPWHNKEVYTRQSASSYVKHFRTPCLVITAERDYRVPYTQSLQFFTDLQKMGVPSRLIVFKNDSHWPDHVKSMPVYYNAHLEWFHKYLKGEPAPYDTEKLIRNQQFIKKHTKK